MAFPTGINSANFNSCAQWNFQQGNVTTVGTNGGQSAYGTKDQSGNVWEWNEETIEENSSFVKNLRGGAWNSTLVSQLSSGGNITSSETTKAFNIGFRLVQFSGIYSFSKFVQVGDTGNAADFNSKGSVNYNYDIMLYPITNSEYVSFLNNVDPSGLNQYSLYSTNMSTNARGGIRFEATASNGFKYGTKANMATKPAVFVDWFCAARMSNWLHNNFGSTESGVYNLLGATQGTSFSRSSGAKFAIPTENEWHKAAFYKADGTNAGYWEYATQSDTAPICVASDTQGNGPILPELPTPTPTVTSTQTPTPTPTLPATPTVTPTITVTSTATPTVTQTNTPTISPTSSITPTVSVTQTKTQTPTVSTTPTITPTTTVTPTLTRTPTVTKTSTVTPTITPTNTPAPFATPSSRLGTPPRISVNNRILDSLFNIKEYIGNQSVSLMDPKCGNTTITDKTQLNIWNNFIQNINTIYATDKIDGSPISFSTIPSGSAFIPDPSSTLRSLNPNESYYFILKEYPNKPIAIPICESVSTSCDELEDNNCNKFIISGIPSNGITISNELYTPINISISGIDCEQKYLYKFVLDNASAPCSIYPISGLLSSSKNSIAKISAIFEFGFDNTFLQQANLSTFLSNSTSDIFSNINFVLEEITSANNLANYGYGKKTAYISQPLVDIVMPSGTNTSRSPSYYGIYDMAGQLYEWTDSTPKNKPNNKIILGGSWMDTDPYVFNKKYSNNYDIYSVFNDGGFGIRIASTGNVNNYPSFKLISDTDHEEDSEDCADSGFGQVLYEYYLMENLVTNKEYCDFLNTVDPLGLNELNLYHYGMNDHISGGISYNDCGNYGEKYVVKLFMDNKPVTFVSWIMAAKYTNWLHNNKGWVTYTNVNNDSIFPSWVDTGITVSIDSVINIKASGLVKYTNSHPITNYTGPEGVDMGAPASDICGFSDIRHNTPYVPIAALVGKIDNERGFYIGSGTTYVSESSGNLYLGINDINCANDNEGKFDVTVEVYDPSTIKDKILNGAYNLTNLSIDKEIYREPGAKYFLPSHREWYKAAYYDHNHKKYWSYPTQSDSAPNQINNICYQSFSYPINIKCSGCKSIFDNGLLCPTISSLTNNILLTPASGDSVSITANISGLVPGSDYVYYFDTIDNNWPCNISPQTAKFTASSSSQTVTSTLTFADPQPLKREFANLPIKSDISRNFDDIYNILKFSLSKLDSNCDPVEKASILRCNDCYSKELITTVKFVTPTEQSHIGVSGLPWAHAPISGINSVIPVALPYGSYVDPVPSDPYIWDNCDKYIPLIVTINNHRPSSYLDKDSLINSISAEKYRFDFTSSASNVTFYPRAGNAYISNSGIITTLVKLNGNNSVDVLVNIWRESTGMLSRDKIGVKCLLADLSCTPTPTPNRDIFLPPAQTPLPSPAPTRTVTPSITPSRSPYSTVTPTQTITKTVTPSVTQTKTPIPSPSPTRTPNPTPSITPTNTITPSITPTNTVTPSITPTNTVTPSITPTITLTQTPTKSVTPTVTVSRTPRETVTPTKSITPTKTATPTQTPTPTPTKCNPISEWEIL